MKRTGLTIRVFYAPMKLSGQRVWQVPKIVIPNLFRDLVSLRNVVMDSRYDSVFEITFEERF